MQANDDKNEPVKEENDRFPKCVSLQACSGSDHERRVPSKENTGSDCRQNARGMQVFSRQVSDERSEQRDRDLDRWIVQMALHPTHRHADKQSNSDTGSSSPEKTRRRVRWRESPGYECGDRKL